jgi:hypothetical protein
MALQRIDAVEWAGTLLFRLRFAGGMTGIVSLAPELPTGSYAGKTVAAAPAAVRIAQRGRALAWTDRDG